MASLQAYLLTAFLKHQVKRKLRGDVDVLRARETLGRVKHPIPAGLAARPDRIGGVPGEWVERVAAHIAPTLLYLHGGGYFACSSITHRPITAAFAQRGLRVFAADYRLAPEHPFPAAVVDAVSAYRGLVASGVPVATLTLAGDSAGGGLALATLLTLRDEGDPLPAACVLFSPWTDLAATGASLKINAKREAMFPSDGFERAGMVYLGGASATDPRASPLYADLHGLPPLLVHAGSYEILLDDSTRVVKRVHDAGGRATLRTWPVVPHVFQLFGFLPETRQSMAEAAAFLRDAASTDARLAA